MVLVAISHFTSVGQSVASEFEILDRVLIVSIRDRVDLVCYFLPLLDRGVRGPSSDKDLQFASTVRLHFPREGTRRIRSPLGSRGLEFQTSARLPEGEKCQQRLGRCQA